MPATIDKLTAADTGFLVAGSPSGPGVPPLVCLHGIGGDATSFMPQLHGLPGRRRTLSWNMPGYGPSAPMAEMSFASLCDRLLVLRRGRAVEQGAAQDILARPGTDYTAMLLAAARVAPDPDTA